MNQWYQCQQRYMALVDQTTSHKGCDWPNISFRNSQLAVWLLSADILTIVPKIARVAA
jgi:hypothetical protein